MIKWLLPLLLTAFSTAHADSAEGPCSLELGGGIQNIEIMNPDFNKSVYDGYGGNLTARYNALANDKFHFALRLSFGYSELENKANMATLSESLKNTSWGPGAELRIYNFFIGAEYQSNKTTIEMGGANSSSVHSSFFSPQVFMGIDIPMNWWGLRAYYMRSQGDIPNSDTGLVNDSPWAQEQFNIAIRINFRHKKTDTSNQYPSYESSSKPAATPSSTTSEGESNSRVYRPVRYYPRPSRSLGN